MAEPSRDEPILVWGAGAIGGTIGAHLVRAGHPVTFVDTDAAHVAAIADPARGLSLEGPVANFTIQAPAFTPEALQGRWRSVLLCVKAQHTEAACRALLPHLAADGVVVSLQNGLTERFMAPVLGIERCMGGYILSGCDWLGPGRILFGNLGELAVGEFDASKSDRLVRIWRALCDFDPKANGIPDIKAWRWGKLVFAVMLHAQALGARSTADALAEPELLPLWRQLVSEATLAGLASGTRPRSVFGFEPMAMLPGVPEAAARHSLDALVRYARGSAKTHSGIWRDLWVRRRATEVDALVGPLVAIAREEGTPFETLQRLIDMIHEAERGELPQADDNLLELLGG